jgi:IS30 family transposase
MRHPPTTKVGHFNLQSTTRTAIQEIENWINRYPRKILNFRTAEELFIQEIAA